MRPLARLDADSFVLSGPAAAVERTRGAAGDRDVSDRGGALIGSGLRDGLFDELRLHLPARGAGASTLLFHGVGRHRLTRTAVEVSPVWTHLASRVTRG